MKEVEGSTVVLQLKSIGWSSWPEDSWIVAVGYQVEVNEREHRWAFLKPNKNRICVTATHALAVDPNEMPGIGSYQLTK